MSLIRSLNSGVSGLKSYQTKMDVIGNNIANVETTGYKSSRVTFAEMMNQKMGRSGGGGQSSPQLSNEVGLGVRVASIDRDFSQGSMNNTGITTDLAIEGEGYFLVNNNGENMMTRAGNFVFNKDGYLVDTAGRGVQGFIADGSGNILGGGATEDIRIEFENSLPPRQTSEVTLAGNLDADTSTTQVLQAQSSLTANSGQIATLTTDLNNLDQRSGDDLDAADAFEFDVVLNDGTTTTISISYGTAQTVGDLINEFNNQLNGANQEGQMELIDGMLVLRSGQLGDSQLDITNVSFVDDTTTGTSSVSMPNFMITEEGITNRQTMSTTVYDNLGRAHSLVLEFEQTNTNEWTYYARFMDGESINPGDETGIITFNEAGQLTSGNNLSLTFDPGSGADDVTFEVSLGDQAQGTSFTQFSGANTGKVIGQDGYAQGELVDITIDGDGRIEGIYNNGNSLVLAQVALATVQNENGIEMVGGGLFRATSAAGEVFVQTADRLSDSSINSEMLEASNVDLAKEFTDMITSQRAYQSSARVITTSDEMLMEAVNLKR